MAAAVCGDDAGDVSAGVGGSGAVDKIERKLMRAEQALV